MAYQSRGDRGIRLQKIKRQVMVIFVVTIVFLSCTSYFMYVAAQDSQVDNTISYWLQNRSKLIYEYENGMNKSDVAGVIYFNKNTVVPFFINAKSIEKGASVFGNTLPRQLGRCIIMGHKDEGFVYLQNIMVGDEIVVDSLEGRCRYIVQSTQVMVPSEVPLDKTQESILTLITQYPFRSINLANRRYVVEAKLVE